MGRVQSSINLLPLPEDDQRTEEGSVGVPGKSHVVGPTGTILASDEFWEVTIDW